MASFQAQLTVGAAPEPVTLWGLRYELTRKADFRNQVTTQASEGLLTLRLEAATNFAWANAWFQAATTHYPLEVNFTSPQGLQATALKLKAQQVYCVGVRLINLPCDPSREAPPPLLEIDLCLGKETAFDLGLEVVAGPDSSWQANYDWAGQGIFHWKKPGGVPQQWPVEEYGYEATQASNAQGVPCAWPQGGRLRVRLPVMGQQALLHNLGQKPRRIGDSQEGEEAHLEVTLGQGRVAYTLVMRQTNVLSWALEYSYNQQGHGTLGQTLVLAAQQEEVVQGKVVNLVAANLTSMRDRQEPSAEALTSKQRVQSVPLFEVAGQKLEKGTAIEQGGNLDEPYFEGATPYQTDKTVEGQRSSENCVPTALKMLLNGMGYTFDADILEDKTGYSPRDGTDIANLPDKFYWWSHAEPPPDWKGSLQISEQTIFTTQQLVDSLAVEGTTILVSINNGKGTHAVVVDAVKDGQVFIRDPLPMRRINTENGEGSCYSIPITIFEAAWLRKENRTKGKAVVFTTNSQRHGNPTL